jgi:hypothetical protein
VGESYTATTTELFLSHSWSLLGWGTSTQKKLKLGASELKGSRGEKERGKEGRREGRRKEGREREQRGRKKERRKEKDNYSNTNLI